MGKGLTTAFLLATPVNLESVNDFVNQTGGLQGFPVGFKDGNSPPTRQVGQEADADLVLETPSLRTLSAQDRLVCLAQQSALVFHLDQFEVQFSRIPAPGMATRSLLRMSSWRQGL